MKKLWLFLCLVLCLGCRKSDTTDPNTPQSSGYMKDGSAVVQGESTTQFIKEVGNGCLLFSSNTPTTALPVIGDVICCGITQQTPFGYLGRATNIQQNEGAIIVTTEAVSIEEAFANLDVALEKDITRDFLAMLDEEDEALDYEWVSDDIWQEFGVETADQYTNTARTEGEMNQTLSIKFSRQGISGTVYAKIALSAKMQTTDNHELKYLDFTFTPIIGLKADAKIKGINDKITLINQRTRPAAVQMGPIVLRPSIFSRLYFGYEATATIQGDLHFEIIKFKSNIHYENGKWTTSTQDLSSSKTNALDLVALELSGKAFVGSELGVTCGVFTDYLYGLGIKADARYTTSSSKVFSLNIETLKENPVITFTPSLTGSLFGYTKLFGGSLGNFEVDMNVDLNLPIVEIPLLPTAKNSTAKYSKTTEVEVNTDFSEERVLEVSESGIALWDEKQVVEHKPQSESRAQSSLTFTIPNDDKEYQISPYVKFKDGTYSYGEKVDVAADIVGTWKQNYKKIVEYDVDDSPIITENNAENEYHVYTFHTDSTGVEKLYTCGGLENSRVIVYSYDGKTLSFTRCTNWDPRDGNATKTVEIQMISRKVLSWHHKNQYHDEWYSFKRVE